MFNLLEKRHYFILFELVKTIEILYELCKRMRSTIVNRFVFMDIFIIKRNKDTGYFLAIQMKL